MSNGDDVLDNWEEIDEAGLNNTLQKIEAVRQTKKELLKSDITVNNDNDTYNTSSIISSTQTTSIDSVDFQPMKLLQRTPTQDNCPSNTSSTAALNKAPLDHMAASFQPVMMVLHKSQDEYQSANYTQPISSQTVKILRRPTQSTEPRNNGMRPQKPIKTLQQREQEYAEARLRILGAAKNPEDDVANSSNNSATSSTSNIAALSSAATSGNGHNASALPRVSSAPKMQTTIAAGNYSNHYQQHQQNYYFSPTPAYNNRATMPMQQQLQQQQPPQPQQTWSPIVGGSVSSGMLRQQQQQQQQQQPQAQPLQTLQQDFILRMPRGPDGSTGFQMRR